jgi:hypothetical protein
MRFALIPSLWAVISSLLFLVMPVRVGIAASVSEERSSASTAPVVHVAGSLTSSESTNERGLVTK